MKGLNLDTMKGLIRRLSQDIMDIATMNSIDDEIIALQLTHLEWNHRDKKQA